MADSDPSIFEILLSKHSYSMSPEDETGWCWACLMAGFIGGFFAAVVVFCK